MAVLKSQDDLTKDTDCERVRDNRSVQGTMSICKAREYSTHFSRTAFSMMLRKSPPGQYSITRPCLGSYSSSSNRTMWTWSNLDIMLASSRKSPASSIIWCFLAGRTVLIATSCTSARHESSRGVRHDTYLFASSSLRQSNLTTTPFA